MLTFKKTGPSSIQRRIDPFEDLKRPNHYTEADVVDTCSLPL